MKLALIRKAYNPDGGGGEKYAAKCAGALVRRGHAVTMVSENFAADDNHGLRWLPVPKAKWPTLCGARSFHRRAQSVIDRDEYDLVYSLCRSFPSDAIRVTEQLHREWMPINYPAWQRLNPRHRGILDLETKSLSPISTRLVITNSNLVNRQVVAGFGMPPETVVTVRNGVDHDRFFPVADAAEKKTLQQNLNIPENKLVLLFAAANFKIKGLAAAMKAIASLPPDIRGNIRMLIAGGDDPAPYRSLTAGIELEFLGRRRDMRGLYAAADLLLYPSLYEPFANVCLEACACGLPVLTTALNGSSELIDDGVNGFVVEDAGHINEISARIAEFAELSPDGRAGFAAAAVNAAKPCTWENHVVKLETLFSQLVAPTTQN